MVRRMLEMLAPDGLLIIEVPNAGGMGAWIFRNAWSGLELPRHLSHFSPESLTQAIELAGGKILWCWHQAKPRYYLRSLGYFFRDRGWYRLERFTKWRPFYGALKLILEMILPLLCLARCGEVIRVGAVPRSSDRLLSFTPPARDLKLG